MSFLTAMQQQLANKHHADEDLVRSGQSKASDSNTDGPWILHLEASVATLPGKPCFTSMTASRHLPRAC